MDILTRPGVPPKPTRNLRDVEIPQAPEFHASALFKVSDDGPANGINGFFGLGLR
ncbi:hypothetical protein [Phaeovulum sp. NW3]|uniref:hypothetical protein n=1 Tax=Phaeovulum sp. NW3 TaxID=2934933 RepID=UPI0020224CB8|nr:hypothetical protein [Phaeovulum sp. NW3]MCL7465553.1 hypothetical protein [Phaeovulum sp. NW3]